MPNQMNMRQQFTPLHQLTPLSYRWTIQVRLTRLWDAINVNTLKPYGIAMTLLDAQNDHIHAMASTSIAPKFNSLLKEGNVYIITNFNVFKADKGYRPVTHEYVIRFTGWTKVTLVSVPVPNISLHKFEFIPFDQIHLRHPQNVQLCDVVGKLTSLGDSTDIVRSDGASTKMRIITLQNISGSTIDITLWGAQTHLVDYTTLKGAPTTYVLVVTSMSVRLCQGQYNLSSTSGTKVYVNLEINEVQEFLRLPSIGADVIHDYVPSMAERRTELRVVYGRRRNILEVKDLLTRGPSFDNIYSVRATVSELLPDRSWWYFACKKCCRKVEPIGLTYFCEHCKTSCRTPVMRYKATVRVFDSTGNLLFTMLDSVATKFFGSSASALRSLEQSANGPAKLEEQFQQSLNRDLILEFELSSFNFQNPSSPLTVRKFHLINYDEEILAFQLKEQLCPSQQIHQSHPQCPQPDAPALPSPLNFPCQSVHLLPGPSNSRDSAQQCVDTSFAPELEIASALLKLKDPASPSTARATNADFLYQIIAAHD